MSKPTRKTTATLSAVQAQLVQKGVRAVEDLQASTHHQIAAQGDLIGKLTKRLDDQSRAFGNLIALGVARDQAIMAAVCGRDPVEAYTSARSTTQEEMGANFMPQLWPARPPWLMGLPKPADPAQPKAGT